MKYRLTLILIAVSLYNSPILAGIVGSGGSPPAMMLPSKQFTEIVLGLLRGEQIVVRSEGVEIPFDATNIDTTSGKIIISSPETGRKFLLQDFDKKFGKSHPLIESKVWSNKVPEVSIPENPNVTTVPIDDDSGGERADSPETQDGGESSHFTTDQGGTGGGGSPPAENGN